VKITGSVAFSALAQRRDDADRLREDRAKVVQPQQPPEKPVVKPQSKKKVVLKVAKDQGITVEVTRKDRPAPVVRKPQKPNVRPEVHKTQKPKTHPEAYKPHKPNIQPEIQRPHKPQAHPGQQKRERDAKPKH
jgi:hypothetical protein